LSNRVKESKDRKQIKNIQNIHQRILKKFKYNPNQAFKAQITSLDAIIGAHYRSKKRDSACRVITLVIQNPFGLQKIYKKL
jgi:hypothetical protein